jgi:hypothetical protein
MIAPCHRHAGMAAFASAGGQGNWPGLAGWCQRVLAVITFLEAR